MRIGVDLDNTIARYDDVFYRVAADLGLVPAGAPISKTAIRTQLRGEGNEDAWTALQGQIYGARMGEATAFPGVREFFLHCRRRGVPVDIISHRTQFAQRGEPYDLHQAARDWLALQGFHQPGGIGLPRERVHFATTRESKLARIAEVGCTHFIDDLPEVLEERSFPKGVTRILFDPAGLHPSCQVERQVSSWESIEELFGLQEPVALPEADVAPLLASAGLHGPFSFRALPGGRNNRVYRIDWAGPPLLLKAYFRHPDDPRDRLGTEFGFLQFAWRYGLRCIPQPLALDAERGLGLYSFIEGTRVSASDVGPSYVDQLLGFFRGLNEHRLEPEAAMLPPASEACFSVAAHLMSVERRLARLGELDRSTPEGEAAARLVVEELLPRWQSARSAVRAKASDVGVHVDQPLGQMDRRISPSDFGFHNTLASDGRLTFVDFEYAGWDDPAKTACDLVLQPDAPVPFERFNDVASSVSRDLSEPKLHRRRISLLLPVLAAKWCCILLNEFLPIGSQRRAFSRQQGGTQRADQLRKIRLTLAHLEGGASLDTK